MRVSVFLFFVACSPNYFFDKGVAPAWTQAGFSKSERELVVIGSAPVTLDPRRDRESALDDARQRLAESLVAEVRARSSDWSMSQGKGREQQSVEASVDVSSDVRVEGMVADQAFRDEQSRMQYMRARVDVSGWKKRLVTRIDTTLGSASDALGAGTIALGKQPAHALQSLTKARAAIAKAEADVRLADVLAPESRAGTRWLELSQKASTALDQLRRDTQIGVTVTGSKSLGGRVESELKTFFAELGLRPGAAPTLRVEVVLGSRFLRTEPVGARTEHVYGATGSARVLEGATEYRELGLVLPEERYTESHIDPKEAEARAQASGADAIVSQLRSQVRLVLGVGK